MEQIAIKYNDTIIDLQTAKDKNIEGEPIYFDNSPEALEVIRHSAAHLMAQAIKDMYPNAKFFVGPVVDEGFYYDFKTDEHISENDLKAIEKRMQELAKRKYEIEKYAISKEEALKKYENDELKKAVLSRIEDENVSFYTQGDFEDLCRGPHLPNTKLLRFTKLTKVAGAYLGGDDKNEMLTRIYGISFADKDALKAHMTMLEEAKKRDHRKLGNELKLFTFEEDVGGGLPIWLPNGARLRSKLEHMLYTAHRRRGYQPVRGPEILRSDLWKTSGHYGNYKENMYFTIVDEQEYGLKPMNCVGHIKVFQSDLHSYRDLPIKYFEYGVVHRHELSGVMHGLMRVREFTQDDAHIFCTPSQIEDIIIEVLGFVDKIMKSFEFDYKMMVSTKPEKAIGDDAVWEISTASIREALDKNGHSYGIDEGGGAFYGPKIDIKITDAIGREWQCGTVQIDFNLPERFDLSYVGENNTKERPVMIHRAILGSFERFIGILTEHFAGEFPFFLAPTQVVFIPISDAHLDYAKELSMKLAEFDIDCEISNKNESLNKRVRTAEKAKVPMIVVLGDEEVQSRSVAVRDRRKREQYNLNEEEFMALVRELMDKVRF